MSSVLTPLTPLAPLTPLFLPYSNALNSREKIRNPANTTAANPAIIANACEVSTCRDSSPASNDPSGGSPKKHVA